jgi:WD40 repeat protein
MVLSKDGNLLPTSDPSGTLYVWALPRLNFIYKLFYEEIVRDLAFSPDGQRIYDSRGALCNLWEPDALIRHDETGRDDASSNDGSDAESSLLSDPITHISRNDSTVSQITALVSDSEDQ